MTSAGLLRGRSLHPEASSLSSPSTLTVDTRPVKRKDSLVSAVHWRLYWLSVPCDLCSVLSTCCVCVCVCQEPQVVRRERETMENQSSHLVEQLLNSSKQ